MRYIQKDTNNNIVAACDTKFDDTFELADEEYELGFDGKLYSESEMQSADYLARKEQFDLEYNKEIIRSRRNDECFPIINRGALWFNKLTESQVAELEIWYQEWLDAPATGQIPSKPHWIY
ncbi:hypothetical protein [uncultured Coprobacter sp.]|uniref:hypothetical protein n=1 Tax=uncultured Coprobacter sp. TaxID=1720550 RepID=UPI00263148F5|nr:hypothetical protein [uncultured Coprobacter sp.]